jgi:hypothetical protein
MRVLPLNDFFEFNYRCCSQLCGHLLLFAESELRIDATPKGGCGIVSPYEL